jgi:hypothetical protein
MNHQNGRKKLVQNFRDKGNSNNSKNYLIRHRISVIFSPLPGQEGILAE